MKRLLVQQVVLFLGWLYFWSGLTGVVLFLRWSYFWGGLISGVVLFLGGLIMGWSYFWVVLYWDGLKLVVVLTLSTTIATVQYYRSGAVLIGNRC